MLLRVFTHRNESKQTFTAEQDPKSPRVVSQGKPQQGAEADTLLTRWELGFYLCSKADVEVVKYSIVPFPVQIW